MEGIAAPPAKRAKPGNQRVFSVAKAMGKKPTARIRSQSNSALGISDDKARVEDQVGTYADLTGINCLEVVIQILKRTVPRI